MHPICCLSNYNDYKQYKDLNRVQQRRRNREIKQDHHGNCNRFEQYCRCMYYSELCTNIILYFIQQFFLVLESDWLIGIRYWSPTELLVLFTVCITLLAEVAVFLTASVSWRTDKSTIIVTFIFLYYSALCRGRITTSALRCFSNNSMSRRQLFLTYRTSTRVILLIYYVLSVLKYHAVK